MHTHTHTRAHTRTHSYTQIHTHSQLLCSGLYGAHLLNNKYDVVVLEAQDTVGGRIKQVRGVSEAVIAHKENEKSEESIVVKVQL